MSRTESSNTQINVRSTSRFGYGGDSGTTARRIRNFFNDLEFRLSQPNNMQD